MSALPQFHLYADPATDPMNFNLGDRTRPLARLMEERALEIHFQPIVSLSDGRIHAHEALIRGPRGTALHGAEALLNQARLEGVLQEFEVACVVLALERWAALRQAGRLFVNISASALVRCFAGRSAQDIAHSVQRWGVNPQCVAFEITEHERVADIPLLVEVADGVHGAGMSFVLDDFGDGRSSLRLWSELNPDVVKIDKYFSRDIAQHAKRLRTLRALMQIADTFGTMLVAEGVETQEDLRVLRDLGCPLVQGYLLGRPAPLPRTAPEPEAMAVLEDRRIAVLPTERMAPSPRRFSQAKIIEVPPVGLHATNDEVVALFTANPEWHAIALVDGEHPVALVGRQQCLDRYAKLYFKEICGRKPCLAFANTEPTLVDVHAGIDELAELLTSPDQRYLNEGFVYVESGRYRGLGTGQQLVRQVTESRIEAARHANPLTLLPGNSPISEHIERLQAAGASFVACYADLSQFKPFNDHYGYWCGDRMIKLLAATIQAHADPRRDFVGHVGGDDFVILFQSADWRVRCERMVTDFDAAAIELYDDEARVAGGIRAEDRHGVERFFRFVSLYMGVVEVGAGSPFRSASDVASAAARAKQTAKQSGVAIHLQAPAQLTALRPADAPPPAR
ncbi:diguanylate phosphodiesterase [Rubrivivax gelatinosus]|nr:diguanylate phosphodiesterase [Rubrivivax gelatinosus]